ncbi:MAG: hypothetical protein ACRDT4_10425 [Micromonosporaceae bacterium]
MILAALAKPLAQLATPLAHSGEFHPAQLLVLLGMGVGPALVILIALFFAGRRTPDEEPQPDRPPRTGPSDERRT